MVVPLITLDSRQRCRGSFFFLLITLTLVFSSFIDYDSTSPSAFRKKLHDVERVAFKNRKKFDADLTQASLLQLFSLRELRDWGGTWGKPMLSLVDAFYPQGCIGDMLSIGYTNDVYNEDDYPFVPKCGTQEDEGQITCFSGNASVMTPGGWIPMHELTVGVHVAVGLTRSTPHVYLFEPVAFFLHRDPDFPRGDWITIEWNNNNNSFASLHHGTLTVSPYHLVLVCERRSCGTAISEGACCYPTAAKRLSAGDHILEISPSSPYQPHVRTTLQTVTHVKYVSNYQLLSSDATAHIGLYAPATASGTLVVNGIVVSQYSTFPFISPRFDSIVHNTSQRILSTLISISSQFSFPPFLVTALLDVARSTMNLLMSSINVSVMRSFI